MKPRGWWIDAMIVLLAFALRIAWLEIRSPHFDEGVNGWFVDQMTRTGYFHYDPGNFHGPLHFYALFVSLTLLGREVWALRLPVVIVSTLGVVAMLALMHPLGVIAAAIFVAAVFVGADAMSRTAGVPSYIAHVMVATSLLTMVTAIMLTRYRVRWR